MFSCCSAGTGHAEESGPAPQGHGGSPAHTGLLHSHTESQDVAWGGRGSTGLMSHGDGRSPLRWVGAVAWDEEGRGTCGVSPWAVTALPLRLLSPDPRTPHGCAAARPGAFSQFSPLSLCRYYFMFVPTETATPNVQREVQLSNGQAQRGDVLRPPPAPRQRS